MTKQLIIIIAFVAIAALMIIPASAETLTGTLGGTNVIGSFEYEVEHNQVSNQYLNTIIMYKPGLVVGSSALIRFDPPGHYCTFSAGAPSGVAGVPFTIFLNGTSPVVTGTMGYQRLFNPSTGAELSGYQYLLFNDDWNTTLSGTVAGVGIPMTMGFTNYSESLYNMRFDGAKANAWGNVNGEIVFGSGWPIGGTYFRNVVETVYSTYSFTKPSGLGISGTINKTVGGTSYYSKVTVSNGSSNEIISNEPTLTNVGFSVTTPSETIRISMLSHLGVWYNSSIFFSAAVPTVTPTPAPTLPPGYVRNNLYIWDQNDAQISGADVDVRDVEAGTWTNTTADADGWITIDTLPYHTVNVYAHYPTSNIYLPNEILGLETGYYGGHNWVLVLYPYVTTPSGFVTLYINTRNYDTKAVLTGVNLQIKNLVTGATTGESTGSTDSVTTVVVNATNYQITGSKSGYLSKTIVINSGEASSKTVVVELSKATVTPTVTGTVLPGEITVRPTYSPGCDPAAYDAAICNTNKDADMMNQIRDAGPGLISLAIIATVIGLIKLMSKK